MEEAKKQHHNRLLAKSNNKIKIVCNIIKKGTGKMCVTEQIHSLQINNKRINDPEKVADVFNSFFQLLKIEIYIKW
jgi:hypothetical protein